MNPHRLSEGTGFVVTAAPTGDGCAPMTHRQRLRARVTADGNLVVQHRSLKAPDERLVHPTSLQWRDCRQMHASTSLDMRERESGERVTDDNLRQVVAHLTGSVERRQPDLLGRQVRRCDLMSVIKRCTRPALTGTLVRIRGGPSWEAADP